MYQSGSRELGFTDQTTGYFKKGKEIKEIGKGRIRKQLNFPSNII